METAILAIIFISTICLLLGMIIGFVAKIFAVNVDSRIEEVEELLPGANCGGCGFAGCSDFAKAVVAEKAEPSQCPVCSPENVANSLSMPLNTHYPIHSSINWFCTLLLTISFHASSDNHVNSISMIVI